MRFLVADHDSAAKSELEAVLCRYGSCDLAGNGEEALALFFEALAGGCRYDLVCVDLALPPSGGGRLLRVIREVERLKDVGEEAGVALVITSEHLSPRETIGAYYYGRCTDFLPKPFQEKQVLELLSSYGIGEVGA